MNDKDVFFYTLIYDPTQKTLLADKGEIRLGKNYQCENIPSLLADPKSDPKFEEDLEEQVWEPNKISAEQIERYKSVQKCPLWLIFLQIYLPKSISWYVCSSS